jgi:hypothetical protein
LSFSGAVVLLGDELAVPAQDGVGRHQAGQLLQRTSADEAALRGEPPALGIGEAQPPTSELLPQDAALFLEVRDDLGLVAVHPAREHGSKNCSGTTDIFGDPTRAEPGAAGFHPTTASRKNDIQLVSPDPVVAPDAVRVRAGERQHRPAVVVELVVVVVLEHRDPVLAGEREQLHARPAASTAVVGYWWCEVT